MLHSAGAPLYLWAGAVNCTAYLQNRIMSKPIYRTAYETWKGVKPNLTHLLVFGSEVFVHVSKGEWEKFDPKAVKCLHMGYCETQKAFRARNLNTKKILIIRDVIFNEIVEKGLPKEHTTSNFITERTAMIVGD